MKFRSLLLSLLAVLLFLAGVLLELALSSGIVWAETEASIFGTQAPGLALDLRCPLLLAPAEAGTVRAVVTNSMYVPASPLLTAEISRGNGLQSLSVPLSLAPHETQSVQWPVTNSNLVFGRLILVNVIQGRSEELALRRGYCGILVFQVFGLAGGQSLVLICAASLLLILVGGIVWVRLHAPLGEGADQTAKACATLAVVSTLALAAALPRWWGLALFLDAFTLIVLGVIFTDFVLFPRYNTR